MLTRFRKGGARRRTRTLVVDVGEEPAGSDPVIWLRQLEAGTMHRLEDYTKASAKLQWIFVGADAEDCHIVVDDDEYVSGIHCLLLRKKGRVYVRDDDSKNHTFLCTVRVSSGMAELRAGSLLTLGETTFLACGQAGADQPIDVLASHEHELLKKAAPLYEDKTRAARGLKVSRATITRWWKRKRQRAQ